MSYYFGKGVAKKTKGLPAPDEVVANEAAFGRYVSYGRRSRFGNYYPKFGKRSNRRKSGKQPDYSQLNAAVNPANAKKLAVAVKNNYQGNARFGMYKPMYFGQQCGGMNPMKVSEFGRRRRRKTVLKSRKGGVKGKKPAAYLRKACKKHGIKCTRKVGKHRVYKTTSVLKRLLRKKRKSSKRRKGGPKRRRSTRRRRTRRSTRRRRTRRRTLFGFKF